MRISVINKSTKFTDAAALAAIVAACQAQLVDVAKAWGRTDPGRLSLATVAPPPAGVDQLVLFDTSDQAGALGYHGTTPDGQPYARVFVAPILDNGGTVSSTPLSISTTISHELCEMYVDPRANKWADNSFGALYALEVCDQVESDAYRIGAVMVSDFLYPSAFNPQLPTGERIDQMGLLPVPFMLRPGGYAVVVRHGTVTQIFGEHYPEWKRASKLHPASRTARRLRLRAAKE